MLSVAFDRTALSLSPLVIDADPFAGDFHLPEDSATWPAFSMRRSYLPDSDWIAGQQLRSAVRSPATLPLTIYAHSDTTAGLRAVMEELEAASSQWAYDISLTMDGSTWTWPADPELPQWGDIDSGMARAHMARASLVVPINPAGS